MSSTRPRHQSLQSSTKEWPEKYGFSMGGCGPCFVTYVKKGSTAARAGVTIGQQIMEVGGHNARDMSRGALEAVASHCPSQPPPLKMCSRAVTVVVNARARCGLGLSLKKGFGGHSIVACSVLKGGPAYTVGVREGDLVLKVRGHKIKHPSHVRSVLRVTEGKISLQVILVSRYTNQVPRPALTQYTHQVPRPALTQAWKDQIGHLTNKVKTYFDGDNERVEEAITEFLSSVTSGDNSTTDVPTAPSLLHVQQALITPQQEELIGEIRRLIPRALESSTTQTGRRGPPVASVIRSNPSGEKTNKGQRSQETEPQKGRPNRGVISTSALSHLETVPNKNRLVYYKTAFLERDPGSRLGLVLKGGPRITVEMVYTNMSASRAGILPGDWVLEVNGVSVKGMNQREVGRLLTGCGSRVRVSLLRHLNPDYGTLLQDSKKHSRRMHTTQESIQPLSGAYLEKSSVNQEADSLSSDSQMDNQHQFPHFSRRDTSLSQQADYLLTVDERAALNEAIQAYSQDRDVERLSRRLNQLFDTPSKAALWTFILPFLPPNGERDLVSGSLHGEGNLAGIPNVGDPRSNGIPIVGDPLTNGMFGVGDPRSNGIPGVGDPHSNGIPIVGDPLSNGMFGVGDPRSNGIPGVGDPHSTDLSFNQQTEFLLTSDERDQLKEAISAYTQTRDVQELMDQMTPILNSDSRRSLWIQILPRLSPAHQRIVLHRLDLPRGFLRDTAAVQSHQNQNNGRVGGLVTLTGYYSSSAPPPENISDHLWERRRHSAASTPPDRAHSTGRVIINPLYNTASDFGSLRSVAARAASFESPTGENVSLLGQTDSLGYDTISLPRHVSHSFRPGRPNTASSSNPTSFQREQQRRAVRVLNSIESEGSTVDVSTNRHINGHSTHKKWRGDSSHRLFAQGHYDWDGDLDDLDEGHLNQPLVIGTGISEPFSYHAMSGGGPIEKNGESLRRTPLGGQTNDDVPMVTEASCNNSFNKKVNQALQLIDDVVSSEERDEGKGEANEMARHISAGSDLPPPAPPPPLAPKPPPLPEYPKAGGSVTTRTLNWQRLSPVDLSQTVWGQGSDWKRITDLVSQIRLEEQFSTMKKTKDPKLALYGQKKRTDILCAKKAYNTSIILAQRRLTTAQIKDALLNVDDGVLSVDLLEQLYKYSPSEEEKRQYDKMKGEQSKLSKVDRFAFEMTRIPSYTKRLEALIFRENLEEKCSDVTKQLTTLEQASQEIKGSTRLVKTLELVLAMGNQLNKGSRNAQSSAFRIDFLNDLEKTKSVDNKTFLQVLVGTMRNGFPDLLNLPQDLPTIRFAAKVSLAEIEEEIREMNTDLKNLKAMLDATRSEPDTAETGRFSKVIQEFLEKSEGSVEHVNTLREEAIRMFNGMTQYLGEARDNSAVSEHGQRIFQILTDFLIKFQNAQKVPI